MLILYLTLFFHSKNHQLLLLCLMLRLGKHKLSSPGLLHQQLCIMVQSPIIIFPACVLHTPSISSSVTASCSDWFSPDTTYTCSVVANNGLDSGPPANITFTTTKEDCMSVCSIQMNFCYCFRFIISITLYWSSGML